MNQAGYLNSLFSHGVQALQSNDLVLAERTFQQILREFPDHPDALHFSGLIHTRRGDHQKAIELIEQAILKNPKNAIYKVNGGRIYQQTGEIEKAIRYFQQATKTSPGFAEAHFNLGNAFRTKGNFEEAKKAYEATCQIEPKHFQAHYNLGNIHLDLGNYKTAMGCYGKSVEANPNYAPAHNNLGVVLQEWDLWEEAEKNYRKSIELNSAYVEGRDNLASLLTRQGRASEARKEYQHISRVKPDQWMDLKIVLTGPVIPRSNIEIDAFRQEIDQALDHFLQKGPSGNVDHLCKLGLEPSSEMIYQGRDDRPLKEKFAGLYQHYIPVFEVPDPKKSKIGFVVTKGHEGVFLKCMKGILIKLADRFDITLICSAPNGERILRPGLNHPKLKFLSIGSEPANAARSIATVGFSILYYWEVGTDSINYFLPFFRLAPVQVTSWGWPFTSGIPNMDYFLSSNGLEEEKAVPRYSEKVVKFNRLPTYYDPPADAPVAVSRHELGVPGTGPLYLCAQNLKKVHPDFDLILKGILENDREGQVLFIKDKQPHLTRLLESRFQETLGQHVSRIHFLDRMTREQFLGLHQLADVILDTIYYTGGANSCYDAFHVGAPIVTLPFDFHRSRYTNAAYRQMRIKDLIADNEQDYISKAVDIANDPFRRKQLSEQILDARQQIFRDQQAVEEFAAWVESLSR